MDKICQQYQEAFGVEMEDALLAEHGRKCPVCQEFAARQRALQKLLPHWKTPESSPDFDLQVMASIAEQQSNRNPILDSVKAFWSMRFAIPVPAAMVLLLVFSLSLFFNVKDLSSLVKSSQANLNPGIVYQDPAINIKGSETFPQNTNTVIFSKQLPLSLDSIFENTGGIGMIIVIPQIPATQNNLPFPSIPSEKEEDHKI